MDKEEIRIELLSLLDELSDNNFNKSIVAGKIYALIENNWEAFDNTPVYSDDYVD